MPSLYLTPEEVKELTDYVTQAAARRWLERNDWPYAQPAGDGWPRVLREYHDARLSGEEKRRPKRSAEPNWRCTA